MPGAYGSGARSGETSSASEPTGTYPAARKARTLAAFPGAICAQTPPTIGYEMSCRLSECATETASAYRRCDLDGDLPAAGQSPAEDHDTTGGAPHPDVGAVTPRPPYPWVVLVFLGERDRRRARRRTGQREEVDRVDAAADPPRERAEERRQEGFGQLPRAELAVEPGLVDISGHDHARREPEDGLAALG